MPILLRSCSKSQRVTFYILGLQSPRSITRRLEVKVSNKFAPIAKTLPVNALSNTDSVVCSFYIKPYYISPFTSILKL